MFNAIAPNDTLCSATLNLVLDINKTLSSSTKRLIKLVLQSIDLVSSIFILAQSFYSSTSLSNSSLSAISGE